MRIEKDFDISIKDSEAEKIVTVGDMHDLVWREIKHKKNQACLTQIAFYRLRDILPGELDIPPEYFVPAAEMENIIPRKNRRKIYLWLAAKSGYRFPKLILNKAVTIAKSVVNACLVVVIFFLLRNYLNWSGETIVLTLLCSFPAIWLGTSRLFEPLRNKLKTVTVRDFVNSIVVLNMETFLEHGISRKEMEFLLDSIISDQVGVEMAKITPGKSFVNDLGVE